MTTIPLPNLVVLFAGIILTVAPHSLRLPIWITAITIALFGWRAWAAWHGERLPRKWLLFLFVLAGMFAVYMSNRTLFGRDAGVTMLVLFLGLKLMETKNERDVVVVAFLCYFIALTNFFYTQSMVAALYTIGTVVTLTTALVGFTAPRRPWRANLRTAGVLLVQAIPVMAILFVLFPRFQGPLWGIPQDAYSSMTGLSDSMTPGTISNLSLSDAIAFRARFEGEVPPRTALYWRGPVLWGFDGRTWRPGEALRSDRYEFTHRGALVRYEVTLEPHNKAWLFGLDLPVARPSGLAGTGVDLTADYQMLARTPIRTRARYSIASYPDYRATGAASDAELQAATMLPAGSNPRTVELGQTWRREARTDTAILERAVEFFKRRGFTYTLEPPLLGEHTADDFIFKTRSGFCEHFSSAFAIAMRAANVPTRVVTGYQGGELNPVDGFMVVRQADAHAWVEVWIGASGWVRVDPTAAAVPSRVERGFAASVPASDSVPLLLRGAPWLAQLRYRWEAASNYWNQWVLGYNSDRQHEFLARLGMNNPSLDKMITIAFWLIFAALTLVVAVMLRRVRPRDPVQRAWIAFCAKLARSGVERPPYEGPEAFARRIIAERPGLAAKVHGVVDRYVELRYGTPGDHATELAMLQRHVREFRT